MSKYPLAVSTMTDAATTQAIDSIMWHKFTMGESVAAFERNLAEWTGAKHAVMVNSGSSANLLMFDAMLKRNRGPLSSSARVLVPAVCWSTTVAPIIQLGLKPVFCDVTLPDLQIDLQKAKAILDASNKRNRPKALVAVHILGKANNMDEVRAFCASESLVLLEDACEALGAHSYSRHVGTFGQMGTLSFFFSHQMTTMEGGAILTDSQKIADNLKSLRSHGWVRDRKDMEKWAMKYPHIDSRFLFATVGYNVRPTEIQGVMGFYQLQVLDQNLIGREETARRVNEIIGASHPHLVMVNRWDAPHEGDVIRSRTMRNHSWMSIALLCPTDRMRIQTALESAGVETRHMIAGNILRHPAFKKYGNAADHPVSERIAEQGLMIGCVPNADHQMLETLEKAVNELREKAA